MGERPIGSRYTATSVLGEGAYGTVWAGHDAAGDRWAIKILKEDLATDPGVVRRYRR